MRTRAHLLCGALLPAALMAQLPPTPGAPPPAGASVEPAPGVVLPAEAVAPAPAAEPVPAEPSALLPQRRDPFWPVGYAPAPPPKPVRPERKVSEPDKTGPEQPGQPSIVPEPVVVRMPDWDRAHRQLKVEGLSRLGIDKASGKPRYVAYVSGKHLEQGDSISVAFEGFVYRWKVKSITATEVSFEKAGKPAPISPE